MGKAVLQGRDEVRPVVGSRRRGDDVLSRFKVGAFFKGEVDEGDECTDDSNVKCQLPDVVDRNSIFHKRWPGRGGIVQAKSAFDPAVPR